MLAEYEVGEELDDTLITWSDSEGNLHDFSSGWTFELKVGTLGSPALLTKTSGITGAATAPNVTIAWSVGEFDTMPPSTYTAQLRARRGADNKDRIQQFDLAIRSVVT